MERLQKFGRHSMRVINRLTKREEQDVDYNFTSSINEETRVITWSIENINHCLLRTGQYYESPCFSAGFSSETKWTLRLYPKGREVAEKVGVFINDVSNTASNDINFIYALQLILIAESKTENEVYTHDPKSLHTLSLHPRPTVLESESKDDNAAKSSEYGTDDLIPSTCLSKKKALLFKCCLKVSCLDREIESCYTGLPMSSTLYDDFKEMYKNGKFSDVTLQVGKKTFPAHKAILAARSKVFAAMFNHETKENQSNIIDIEDVESSVMNSVLQYIYTGKVEKLTMDEAASMFFAADKYSLEELQNLCVRTILQKLSVENVCQIAVLADMHSVSSLKAATNCIFRKYMHEIAKKKEWKKLIDERPQLASNILHTVSSNLFNTELKYQE